MPPRAPRYEPKKNVSAVLVSEEKGKHSAAGKIVNINVDGCCIEIEAKEPKIPHGDCIVKLRKNDDQHGSPIPAIVRRAREVDDGNAWRYHVYFNEPNAAGRQTKLASSRVAMKDPFQEAIPTDFVNSEVAWRAENVRHRTANLLKLTGLYATALGAIATYSAFGFKALSGEGVSAQSKTVFAWIGIGLIGILFAAGLFLIRFAGYTFCSNIMNRKRIVALRAAYAKSMGFLALIPPPRRTEDVWISGGFKSFPYMFAVVNFSLLLILTPFVYLLVEDTYSSPLKAVSAWIIAIICIAAIPYPRSCHRFAADIFVAKHFYDAVPPGATHRTETQKELKDYYNDRLKKIEQRKRPRQTVWLAIYFVASMICVISCGAYLLRPDDYVGMIGVLLLAMVAVLRAATIQYRIPRHSRHQQAIT